MKYQVALLGDFVDAFMGFSNDLAEATAMADAAVLDLDIEGEFWGIVTERDSRKTAYQTVVHGTPPPRDEITTVIKN